MPATANYSLPYPSLSSANNVPADLQALADAVDSTIATQRTDLTPRWSTYTVSWDSDGTRLQIVDGTLLGRYSVLGKICHYQVLLRRGTSSNVGSGPYGFSLPRTAASYMRISGAGYCSRGNLPVTAIGTNADRIGLLVPGGRISNTNPGSWGSGDIIFVSGSYEIA